MHILIPLGFRFAGIHAGIKKHASKEDLTLIHCPEGAVAAGVYTTNLVFAAPVAFDRERTPSLDIRVVVVNSGNANACTGDRGIEDARDLRLVEDLGFGDFRRVQRSRVGDGRALIAGQRAR